MKFIVSIFAAVCLILTPSVFAQENPEEASPKLTINNSDAKLNELPYSSKTTSTVFEAPESYIKGQELTLELNTNFLRLSEEEQQKSTFTWDFGDGSKKDGKKVSYSYKESGTFFIKVEAKLADVPFSQELTSAKINILPSKNYKIPQAIITVDGNVIENPNDQVTKIKEKQKLNFDATKSISESAPIKTYEWDFLEGEKKFGQSTSYIFQENKYQEHYVLLRLKDENNLISDAYVKFEIESEKDNPTEISSNIKNPKTIYLAFIGAMILALVIISAIAYKKISKNNK